MDYWKNNARIAYELMRPLIHHQDVMLLGREAHSQCYGIRTIISSPHEDHCMKIAQEIQERLGLSIEEILFLTTGTVNITMALRNAGVIPTGIDIIYPTYTYGVKVRNRSGIQNEGGFTYHWHSFEEAKRLLERNNDLVKAINLLERKS